MLYPIKTKFKLVGVLIVAVVIFTGLVFPTWAGPPGQEPMPPGLAETEPVELLSKEPEVPKLSTPQLLQAALDRGDIDQDTYLLYLYYAFYDYEQLPAGYHSNAPWDGTMYMLQLQQEAANIQNPDKRSKVVIQAGSCGGYGSFNNQDNASANFHIEYNGSGNFGGG